MSEQQPITPPPELAREWAIDSLGQKPPWLYGDDLTPACMLLAAKAVRWGWEQRGAVNEAELQRARDEELELCEALILRSRPSGGRAWTAEQAAVYDALTAVATELRAVLRPKPPSLAEQGLIETRNALSSDEPAVPEGREPASVTGEPSDAEGPSIEDVEELCEEHCFNVEGYESIECLQGLINEAIARWGHQPAPPADGEVAELVAALCSHSRHIEEMKSDGWPVDADMPPVLNRAAELLMAAYRSGAADAAQALEPVKHVPVSERLWDREGWCDEHGRCWFGTPRDGAVDPGWILRKPSERLLHQTVSLPAHALPLP